MIKILGKIQRIYNLRWLFIAKGYDHRDVYFVWILMFEFYIMNEHCFCNQKKKSVKNEKEEDSQNKNMSPIYVV